MINAGATAVAADALRARQNHTSAHHLARCRLPGLNFASHLSDYLVDAHG